MAVPKINARSPEKHGMSKTREHNSWSDMLSRCYNPKVQKYRYYGGSGIGVCEEWQRSFVAFYEHMGPCPPGHTLDRIDGNKDYEPGNCRWVTQKQQMRNTRRSRMYTHNGKTQCLTDWANEHGLNESTLRRRLNGGMTIEKALTFDDTGSTLTHGGRTLTIKQWAAVTGLHVTTIRGRIYLGWSAAAALTTPVELAYEGRGQPHCAPYSATTPAQ